jgi:L,D-peptidoglycan transpeptidase YkuD (ErfK/YbiS/YcfS/YnhG family)
MTSTLLTVTGDGWLTVSNRRLRAAIGRGGIRPDKREGDGATPAGTFPLRALWYRADRLQAPRTRLDCIPITRDSGWSDDPADPAYNRPVALPHPGRHERLWRADGLYDLMIPLGYNDAPVEPGLGSAIFLHVAHSDYRATEGCVAIALGDLLQLLPIFGADTSLRVVG